MLGRLPLSLLCVISSLTSDVVAFPRISGSHLAQRIGLTSPFSRTSRTATSPKERRDDGSVIYANGSSYLWVIEDVYEGDTFFDRWSFYDQGDPTHGTVNYLNQSAAFSEGLAYVSNGKVVMKGDNTTWLSSGQYRDSVRISSNAQYNTGLFILDVDRAPWGCGVWPAFWTVGGGTWPQTGEIDIIEGVHDNEHNQVTWHTGTGCTLDPSASFTGSIVQTNGQDNLDCNGAANGNAGCGITEWSRASYGPTFDAQGGGVFAMKWDEEGIAVWGFYREAVPGDITDGEPNPTTWGAPVAALDASGCNPITNFVNHSIIFDITFCGDWAGNSYATSGCPGTCADRIMDPNNFVNASWIINTLKVYNKQNITGTLSAAAPATSLSTPLLLRWCFGLLLALATTVLF